MPSPDAAAQKMIENLPAKTGKSLDQWLHILAKKKLDKHGEIVKWIKTEHGVTHGFANLIAHKFREVASGVSSTDVDLVGAQYSGAKAALRPIYDAIIKVAASLGDDVEVAPKKTYVSLRRNKQFALASTSGSI